MLYHYNVYLNSKNINKSSDCSCDSVFEKSYENKKGNLSQRNSNFFPNKKHPIITIECFKIYLTSLPFKKSHIICKFPKSRSIPMWSPLTTLNLSLISGLISSNVIPIVAE